MMVGLVVAKMGLCAKPGLNLSKNSWHLCTICYSSELHYLRSFLRSIRAGV